MSVLLRSFMSFMLYGVILCSPVISEPIVIGVSCDGVLVPQSFLVQMAAALAPEQKDFFEQNPHCSVCDVFITLEDPEQKRAMVEAARTWYNEHVHTVTPVAEMVEVIKKYKAHQSGEGFNVVFMSYYGRDAVEALLAKYDLTSCCDAIIEMDLLSLAQGKAPFNELQNPAIDYIISNSLMELGTLGVTHSTVAMIPQEARSRAEMQKMINDLVAHGRINHVVSCPAELASIVYKSGTLRLLDSLPKEHQD